MSKMKRLIFSLFVVFVSVLTLLPLDAMAAEVDVSASREDTYNLLLDAAQINVVANTLMKCIGSIPASGSSAAISGTDAAKGNVFSGGLTGLTNTDISTALWVESWVQGNGGDDGAIWCKQAGGKGNILQIFANKAGLNLQNDIICNGGNHRLLQRATVSGADGFSGTVSYSLGSDTNCSSFNDTGAAYLRAPDAAAQFKEIYTNWYNQRKTVNRYVPSYDELGKFNNVDGYFNYIADFNQVCKADVVNSAGKIAGTDYYKITKFKKDARTVVAQNLYYHVNNNVTWKYPLSTDNPVTSCTGLLGRISALQTKGNGVPMNGRAGGYENIILAELNDACAGITTKNGNNGWSELSAKLQSIINNPNSSADEVQKAQANLQKVNNAINSGNYIESSGNEDDDGGKIYQCLDIDGLDIAVDDYETFIPEDQMNQNKENDPCYAGSGALGWIICPVVKGISGVGEHMWEQIETHHLKIQASELFGSGSDVATAWGVVRNIANILFIILFLMVIFSQLTGIGIDNYGIKRILPKLIVVAILVNLSYIICELAIDLSNILGVGINDLLSDAAGNVDIGAPANIASQATGGIAVLGLVGGGAWLYTLLNPLGVVALGLAVLGLVITIVVSMFFLYLTLIVREAGVILAVVIAPVAFVCYLLPNTERYYKKWFDIFKALLIVYPICGALIGAGKLAGAVLASIDTPSMKVAAMLVQVVPFFLIPTMLKNSLSLMGNIGGKLSGWGRSLGRRGSNAAQGAIRGTRAVQDYSRYNQDRRSLARAERIRDRLGNRLNSGANLSARERSQWATASHQVAAAENQKEREYGEIFERYERPQVQAEFASAIGGNDAERASAALTSLLQKGGIDEALTIMDGNNWNNMSQNVRDRLLQTMGGTNIDAMKSFAKYRQTGGQAEFKDWSRGTGAVIASEASNAAIKDKTFAAHLLENGEHATDSYSKDEMQFINRRSSDLIGLMGQQQFGRTLSSMAMNSKDAKAQTEMEKVIAREIGGGTLSVSDLGLTAESIGRMRGDFARALEAGYVNAGKTRANLQADLAPQIAAASADSRISNRTDADVKTILGMP